MMISNRNKGFTTIELMVVISLIIILTAIGGPHLLTAYDNYKFSSSMRSLVSAMAQAKSKAANDGVQTAVNFIPNANGVLTYNVFIDDGTGGGTAINGVRDGGEELIATGSLYDKISINAINTSLPNNIQNNRFTEFNSLGFAMGAPGGNIVFYNGNIRFDAQLREGRRFQTITINPSGLVRIITKNN
jgi:type IV fimbrial biogenesis protein FimT